MERRKPTSEDGSLRARYSKASTVDNPLPSPLPSDSPVGLVQPSGRLPPLVGAPRLEKRSSFATKLRSSMGFGDMFSQHPVSNPLQPPVDAIFLTNTRIASSLLLQQLLYYNCWFSPCWAVAVLVSYLVKFENGTLKDKLNDKATTEDELAVILGAVWLLIEPIRLRLGYSGNLKEKVPFLIVFILITAFPQVAINVYFAAAQKDVDAFDLAMGTVSVFMLAFQLVASVYAIVRIVQSQDEQFYLEDPQALLRAAQTAGPAVRREAGGARA